MLGTTRAQEPRVTDDSVKQRRLLEAQVERWTAEAKKLTDAGKDAAGLELYRRAADELPGAPWLQHRTAELARKLKRGDVAIIYFRRAATAFQIAEFPKRAVAPLRTAWSLAIEGLPAMSRLLVEIATELVQLHRRLGFAADATVTFERTNSVLRAHGFSELGPQALESPLSPTLSELRQDAEASATPPSSRPGDGRSAEGPKSDVAPRSAGSLGAASAQAAARSRALARMLGRRG
jgi:hypothetical protein